MSLPENFIFTQSNLQDYLDCQRRFELRYLKKIKWPARTVDKEESFQEWVAQGNQFHFLLHQYFLGLEVPVLEVSISDPIVMGWWKSFTAWFNDQRFVGTFFPEYLLYASINQYKIAAKFDLILRTDHHKYYIFDWKTSHTKPLKSLLMQKIQSHLYPLLLAKAGDNLPGGKKPFPPESIEMIYWFANQPESPVHRIYDKFEYEDDSNLISDLLNQIQGKDIFPLTENLKYCHYCIFRTFCNRESKPGSEEQLDDLSIQSDLDFLLQSFSNEIDQIGEAWL